MHPGVHTHTHTHTHTCGHEAKFGSSDEGNFCSYSTLFTPNEHHRAVLVEL